MALYSAASLERGLLLTLLRRGGLEEADLVQKLAYALQSDGEDEKHEWLGQPPQLSLFKGSRKDVLLTSTDYTISNEVFDTAVNISRDDLRRNRSGSIQRRLNQMADVVMNFPNLHLTDKIVSGTTDLCYDGESFYGNSHPARKDEGGAQDNLLAGTGTTVAQISADISASLSALRLVKAENGEPFHSGGDLAMCFMVPPALEVNFKTAVEATIISNTSNQLVGIGEVIVNNRLTDVNDWYTFCKTPGSESLIFQWDQNLETDYTGEGSEMWTQKRQAQFGASLSVGVGYGFWQSSNKTVNA